MAVKQYHVWLTNLDPTVGSEIRKTRPCVIISPSEMNEDMRTVQIAPMTSNTRHYPWRVYLEFQKKQGAIALDQIRCIDKRRLIKRLGSLQPANIQNLKQILYEMLIA